MILPDVGRAAVDKSYSIVSAIGTEANSLGFPNSNNPLLYFLVITINGAFLFSERKKRRLYALVMLLIATIIFIFTLSVTGYICILLFLGVYALASKNLLRILRFSIPIIALMGIALTPWIAVNYGYDNGNIVNKSLSGRPYLWNLRVSDGAYGNIVGDVDNFQPDKDTGEIGYTLDNQYLLLLARYGWIVLLIFLCIYFTGVQKITNPAVISGLLTFSIYFMAESIMFILVICIIPAVLMSYKVAKQLDPECRG